MSKCRNLRKKAFPALQFKLRDVSYAQASAILFHYENRMGWLPLPGAEQQVFYNQDVPLLTLVNTLAAHAKSVHTDATYVDEESLQFWKVILTENPMDTPVIQETKKALRAAIYESMVPPETNLERLGIRRAEGSSSACGTPRAR